jgi:hypothetical protein
MRTDAAISFPQYEEPALTLPQKALTLPPQQLLMFVGLGIVVGVPIFLAISAVILRIACSMSGVSAPGFGKALSVTFVADLVSSLGAFFIGLLLVLTNKYNLDPKTLGLIANGVNFPLGAVMSAAIYSGMLPSSFGKGLLIWFIQFLMVVGVSVAVGVAIALTFLAMR